MGEQQWDARVDLQKFENAHYLTVSTVALTMYVSHMTVYGLLHSGELRAVRFGKPYRVREEAMEEYLAAARHAAATFLPPRVPQGTGPHSRQRDRSGGQAVALKQGGSLLHPLAISRAGTYPVRLPRLVGRFRLHRRQYRWRPPSKLLSDR